MNLHAALNTVFDRLVLAPEDFPKEARIRVRTFDWQEGELDFTARVVGPSSASHLRIRTDDGLVFIVPAGDCDLVEAAP
jgi:hypothetical protein